MISLQNDETHSFDKACIAPPTLRDLDSSAAFDPLRPRRQIHWPPVYWRRATPEAISLTSSPPQPGSLSGTPIVDSFRVSESTVPLANAKSALRVYRTRILELEEAVEDQGGRLNPASEEDFWRFVQSVSCIRRGNLVMLENGNLRAMWRGDHGTHIGLQFLGEGMVQYVIFKLRSPTGHISRVAGRDTIEGVKRQIRAFDLNSLLSS